MDYRIGDVLRYSLEGGNFDKAFRGVRVRVVSERGSSGHMIVELLDRVPNYFPTGKIYQTANTAFTTVCMHPLDKVFGDMR